MKAKEVMTIHPEMISANEPVINAAKKMKDFNVGSLPVSQENKLAGVITDRDIVLRAVSEKRDLNSTRVGDIMSRGAITCNEDWDIQECAKVMEEKQVRRVVVTNKTGDPSGIISVGDLATKAGEEIGGEIISRVSQPSNPKRG
ncbi:MAG: CBS domain-containing protein [Fibrobacter sp.]|nr:CBS domain-containing protein [Fibrobacter sp.]